MLKNNRFEIIAKIHTDFPEKFGLPRQSGLISQLKGEIVFEKEYRDPSALKGLEGFSHIWLLWDFSCSHSEGWNPTVRPPRLGGNKRLGVFATRSPFRPNPIGLSCVKLEEIKPIPGKGTVLIVSGVDLMDGTPILDIKPYLPYADCIPTATGGFAEEVFGDKLEVEIPEKFKEMLPEERLAALVSVLANDPRPGYKEEGERIYAFSFAEFTVKFKVENGTAKVTDLICNG